MVNRLGLAVVAQFNKQGHRLNGRRSCLCEDVEGSGTLSYSLINRRDSVLTLQLIVSDLNSCKASHMILEVTSLTCRCIPHWHSDDQWPEHIQCVHADG